MNGAAVGRFATKEGSSPTRQWNLDWPSWPIGHGHSDHQRRHLRRTVYRSWQLQFEGPTFQRRPCCRLPLRQEQTECWGRSVGRSGRSPHWGNHKSSYLLACRSPCVISIAFLENEICALDKNEQSHSFNSFSLDRRRGLVRNLWRKERVDLASTTS